MGASAAGCRGTDKQAADLELRRRLSVCLLEVGEGMGLGRAGRRVRVEVALGLWNLHGRCPGVMAAGVM